MTSIREFFEHRNVFVTGGTGFLGRVLLEKLLRSCPDVGNIYVLVRNKKGKGPSQRVHEITESSLFDALKRCNPDNLKKIIPLLGDCKELGLGLSPSDRQLLEEKVSVVFHCAATVRFDYPLKSAVIMNVRGTREVMLLARNMKELKVVVYVSTCYSNCDRPVVDEVIYPAHCDWKEIIHVVENTSENVIDILTRKIIGRHPNTYTFTKSLAECMVRDLGVNLPVAIVRPSIVMPTLSDPFPGWMDSVGGPMALSLGSAKGILRIMTADPNAIMDMIPVDIVTKIMCLAAREKAVCGNRDELSVFNASAYSLRKLTWGTYTTMCLELVRENPLNDVLWTPHTYITENVTLIWIFVILFQLIPSVLLSGILRISGKDSILLIIQRKLYFAMNDLSYFTTKSWDFRSKNVELLRQNSLPADAKEFNVDEFEQIDFRKYFIDTYREVRQTILKDSPVTTPEGWTHYRRVYWLGIIVRVTVAGFFLWNIFHSRLVKNLLPSA